MATNDQPEQSYYPACKVRLVVRLDEFGNAGLLTSKVPQKTTKNLDGTVVPRSDLQVVPDPAAPPGTQRYLIQAPGSGGDQAAQQVDSSGDGQTFTLGAVTPTEADWEQNGIRHADTLKVTIRKLECPIDPRLCRSVAVEFYLGTITAADYRAGVEGKTRAQPSPATGSLQGSELPVPMNMLPDEWTDDAGRARTNLRFRGFVDEWEDDVSEDGEPVIRLSCTDNTTLFLNQPRPAKLVLSMKDPIDKAVAGYLSNFPQFQGLAVEFRPQGQVVPSLEKSLGTSSFRPNLGPQATGAGSGHSVLDYLAECCGAIGLVCFVDGVTFVIQQVRTLYAAAPTSRADDPFQGRTVAGSTFNVRRFIYGRNVDSYRAKKKFAKRKVKNIEIRSYDCETKSVVVARFPLPEDRQAFAIPGDAKPDQEWEIKYVQGVKDQKVLRAIAQDLYEQVGRNELEFDLETVQLASFGGGNTDPDILDLKVGDPVEVLVARDDPALNGVVRIESLMQLRDEGAAFMRYLGFSGAFADAVATAYANAGVQTVFRTSRTHISFSDDDGVKLKVTGHNYVEVRADKTLPESEQQASNEAPAPPPQAAETTQAPAGPGDYGPPPVVPVPAPAPGPPVDFPPPPGFPSAVPV